MSATGVTIAVPFVAEPEAMFRDAVKSIFAQSHTDWELLLVGDGDAGQLGELARAVRDPRVTVLVDRRRRGLPWRLNQIAGEARCDVLVRMDADDVMHPDRIVKQLAVLQAGYDVVGSRAYAIDDDGAVLGRFREPPLPVTPHGFLRHNALAHPTVLGWTEWFRRNPYRSDLLRGQDKELWLRTCAHSRFYKSPESLLFYRMSSTGSMRRHVQTFRYDRTIIREAGPRLVGRPSTAAMIYGSFLAEAASTMVLFSGQGNYLRRRRIESLDGGAGRHALDALAEVGKTVVPGW